MQKGNNKIIKFLIFIPSISLYKDRNKRRTSEIKSIVFDSANIFFIEFLIKRTMLKRA